jgi:hypothetical protein
VRIRSFRGRGFEFEPRDLWIGVYWNCVARVPGDPNDTYEVYEVYEVWVCVIPTLPFLVLVGIERSQNSDDQTVT